MPTTLMPIAYYSLADVRRPETLLFLRFSSIFFTPFFTFHFIFRLCDIFSQLDIFIFAFAFRLIFSFQPSSFHNFDNEAEFSLPIDDAHSFRFAIPFSSLRFHVCSHCFRFRYFHHPACRIHRLIAAQRHFSAIQARENFFIRPRWRQRCRCQVFIFSPY